MYCRFMPLTFVNRAVLYFFKAKRLSNVLTANVLKSKQAVHDPNHRC
jgi:hypothetical protein